MTHISPKNKVHRSMQAYYTFSHKKSQNKMSQLMTMWEIIEQSVFFLFSKSCVKHLSPTLSFGLGWFFLLCFVLFFWFGDFLGVFCLVRFSGFFFLVEVFCFLFSFWTMACMLKFK